jgi:hypothetical protein
MAPRRVWARRYLPAEITGLVTALAAALVGVPVYRLESERRVRRHRWRSSRLLRDNRHDGTSGATDARPGAGRWQALAGPAGTWRSSSGPPRSSTPARPPGLMFTGRWSPASLIAGTLVGQARRRHCVLRVRHQRIRSAHPRLRRSAPKGAPTMPAARTPYLLLDLDAVTRAYDGCRRVPGVTLHYGSSATPIRACSGGSAIWGAGSRSRRSRSWPCCAGCGGAAGRVVQ